MFRLEVAWQADKPVSLLYAHKPRLLMFPFLFSFVGSLLSIVIYKPGSLFSFYNIGFFFVQDFSS